MFSFKDVYINDYVSLVGPQEFSSGLTNSDITMEDYYYGEATIEKCEIKMQNMVLDKLIKINHPNLIIGGELSNQLAFTNMSMRSRNIPFMGIYSACASSAEGFIILANMISAKQIKNGIFITSSHNLTAEKQFRFPIEYGGPKPKRSTYTATASIGFTLSSKASNLKIINGTIGKVIDSGVKDVHNAGAVMAPSAVETLISHLRLTKTKIIDYDLILTGDLGRVGSILFKEVLQKEHNLKITNHLDAGTLLYENEEYSGGSGPAILPLIFVSKILPMKKYKRILYIATGALYSPVLVNQKNSLPAVSHAVTIEVIK